MLYEVITENPQDALVRHQLALAMLNANNLKDAAARSWRVSCLPGSAGGPDPLCQTRPATRIFRNNFV